MTTGVLDKERKRLKEGKNRINSNGFNVLSSRISPQLMMIYL
jgi:hypothetical protein